MDHDIQSEVAKYENLSVKENKGNRWRIMNSGTRPGGGSLWFKAYSTSYRLMPSGDFIDYIDMHRMFGEPHGVDFGREFWLVKTIDDVRTAIRVFASIELPALKPKKPARQYITDLQPMIKLRSK